MAGHTRGARASPLLRACWPCVVVLVSVALMAHSSSAVVFKLDDTQFTAGMVLLYRVGMWTRDEAPSSHGPSFARIVGDFHWAKDVDKLTSQVQVAFYHSDDADNVGYLDTDGKKVYCGDGTNEDLIVTTDTIRVNTTQVPGPVNLDFPVDKSGVHYFVVAWCHRPMSAPTGDKMMGDGGGTRRMLMEASSDTAKQDSVKLYFSGTLNFRNPYGELPGGYYRILPFYLAMTLLYGIVGIVWIILCVKHWSELLRLQMYIGGVIVLSILESVCWYVETSGWNDTGLVSSTALGFSLTFTLLRKTFARLLILVVVMGYGVVVPTLGKQKWQVIIFAALYLVLGGLFELMNARFRAHEIPVYVLVMFAFPVALMDALLYTWIFYSLVNTIKQLDSSNQDAKMHMYKLFAFILGFYAICALLWLIYVTFVNGTRDYDHQWKSLWTFDAFWEVLYFFVMLAIMIIWRPTSDNHKYAYQELATFDPGEETDEENDQRTLGTVDVESARTTAGGVPPAAGGKHGRRAELPVGRGPGQPPPNNAFSIGSAEDDLFDDEEDDLMLDAASHPVVPLRRQEKMD